MGAGGPILLITISQSQPIAGLKYQPVHMPDLFQILGQKCPALLIIFCG